MPSVDDILSGVNFVAHKKRLVEIIVPRQIQLLELSWEEERKRFPVIGAFDLKNPRTKETVKGLANRITDMADTTKDSVRGILDTALNGDGPIPSTDKVAKLIRDSGATNSVSRSKLIATTEVANAMTQGALLGYEASGVVKEIEWLTTEDESTDDICSDLNGKRVKLGENFDGYMPPAHPGCRCTILPRVD